MYSQGYGEVGQQCVLACLEEQIGKFVCGIAAISLYAAQSPVVPFGHACVFGAVCLAGNAVYLHDLALHDLEKFQNFIIGNAAFINVGSVVRIHVLIESACGSGGGGQRHQESEPKALQGFAEVFCGIFGYFAAYARHLQQFCASNVVSFFCSHLFGQICIAMNKTYPRFKNDYDGFPEVTLFYGIARGVAKIFDAFFRFVDNGSCTLSQDALIVYANKEKAGAKTVAAHGKAAAGAALAVFPRGQNNAGFHKGPHAFVHSERFAHLADKIGVKAVACEMFVEPVQLCFILGIYAVYFTLEGFYFVGSPHTVLVLHFKTERLACAGAAEQIVGLNEDGYIVKHVCVELGAAQQSRLAAGCIQRLVCKLEIFNAKGVFADF